MTRVGFITVFVVLGISQVAAFFRSQRILDQLTSRIQEEEPLLEGYKEDIFKRAHPLAHARGKFIDYMQKRAHPLAHARGKREYFMEKRPHPMAVVRSQKRQIPGAYWLENSDFFDYGHPALVKRFFNRV